MGAAHDTAGSAWASCSTATSATSLRGPQVIGLRLAGVGHRAAVLVPHHPDKLARVIRLHHFLGAAQRADAALIGELAGLPGAHHSAPHTPSAFSRIAAAQFTREVASL